MSVDGGGYDAFRQNGAPSLYEENPYTRWLADTLLVALIVSVCILAVSFYCILPGIPGRDGLFTFLWVTASLLIAAVILVTNFSYEWESAVIHTSTKYKAGTGAEVHAKLGLHVGLRGINVTMKGEPMLQLNETINYNEHFGWAWRQGKNGFGPFASAFNQQYSAAQFRGLPLPILRVAEYFTLDGGGLRWGRFYLESGLFANMCLWLAFALWLLSNILFFILLRYGAYFLVMTGVSMCTANAIKHFIRNFMDLEIPFAEDHIRLEYGVSFWLCLATGCFCILCGGVVLFMDLRYPAIIARFFSVDVLQDEDVLGERDVSQIFRASSCHDLTEIVEESDNGRVVHIATVCDGKGTSEQHEGDHEDEYTSDTDTDATDDEYEVQKEKPRAVSLTGSHGVFAKFQRARRKLFVINALGMNGKPIQQGKQESNLHVNKHAHTTQL